MNRVSTAGNYQSALMNLMSAQSQERDAQTRLSTHKVATDMAGFGRGAESLTALKGAQSRVQGFIDTGDAVVARLESQDLALNQVGDAVTAAAEAIRGVLSSGSADVLMLQLQNQFQMVQGGLNAQHQGSYMFAGGDTTNAPVTVSSMAELAAAPDVASTFGNDQVAQMSRLGESTSIKTGYLADEVGTDVFQIFRDIQAYHEDPATGPLTGKPTDAQKTFLTTQISRLTAAATGVVNITARNGTLQKQVESINTSHAAQALQLEEMVSNKTDADMIQAATDLQLSQTAVQAAAQVISQLSQVTLLDYLR